MALSESEFGILKEWRGHIQPVLMGSFVFLCCLEAWLWVRNHTWKKNKLPGPFAWPIVGNAMQLGQMPHITFANLAKRYGSVYQIKLGSTYIVVLNGDSLIRKALLKHSVEFAGRPNFVSFQSVSGGTSITFRSYSTQWKAHRKIAQATIHAFSNANSKTKKSFEKHIADEAEELVESFIRKSSSHQYFNPSHELTVAAANIICALCFGKRYGHEDQEFRMLLGNVNRFSEVVGAGSLVDVMPWLQSFPNPMRTAFQSFKELNRDFFTFVKEKVMEHRQSYDPEVTRDMSDAFIGVIDQADKETGLTEAHTEGAVSDLIGAGLDTVSTALNWMLLLLVKYPSIQRKLQEQIDKVVGRERLPSVEDKADLAVLEAFIYETMRFTSFIPVTIPHSTTSDVSIEGLNIPKDTVVFINQWSVNHDPEKWLDPHIFNPWRFLDENGALDKDLSNSVMIFSIGRRRCIGDQIAKVEVFVILAILIHQLAFEKDSSQELTLDCSYGLTLKPFDYKISAKPRGSVLNSP
ncbi:hypothetical protein DNTS_022792 [Danionella cerebrum]|uniref:Uncharacterized protein n=1 Tax=Danionella cerebrum TaxID=2873325 RepID=A0A553MTM5_9TELE|nr:hypothetical protein DNTS_022792 [Danionella translucida]